MLQWCEGSVWNSSQYGEGLQGWEPFSVLNAASLVDPKWLFGQVSASTHLCGDIHSTSSQSWFGIFDIWCFGWLLVIAQQWLSHQKYCELQPLHIGNVYGLSHSSRYTIYACTHKLCYLAVDLMTHSCDLLWCDGVYNVRKQIGYIKVHSCFDWFQNPENMILDNPVKPYSLSVFTQTDIRIY